MNVNLRTSRYVWTYIRTKKCARFATECETDLFRELSKIMGEQREISRQPCLCAVHLHVKRIDVCKLDIVSKRTRL